MSPARVLYISYDGALEPLGQSQILPYLRGLASMGAAITLISFEKRADIEAPGPVQTLRAELSAQGIRWIPLNYHKRPTLLATSFDLLIGLVRAWTVVRRDRVGIVHARSYVAALMAWLLKRLLGVRFIFDMRGFWADERIEGGLWPRQHFLYRLVKKMETRFLIDADHVVTLTQRAREELARLGVGGPVSVIPTCVDLDLFQSGAALPPPLVFVYAGSVGTWYLLGEMLDFFVVARAQFPGAKFLLLTSGDDALIQREIRSRGGVEAHIVREAAEYRDVPAFLARAHVGVAFYRPGYSRCATCPTKVGEYLACGLPVVVNRGVGDTEAIIGATRVGAIVPELTPDGYHAALSELAKLIEDPALSTRCREVATLHFSLEAGVERYCQIYRELSA